MKRWPIRTPQKIRNRKNTGWKRFFYIVSYPGVFRFLVPCDDVGYDFRLKTMFGSSLQIVVCMRARVLLYCWCLFVHSDVQHFVLSSVFMFWVPCCDVSYDFRLKTMFGSSLSPPVCRRAHVLFIFFVFVEMKNINYHIVRT